MREENKGEGITFLVGAGAEVHYGLPLGDSFSINTLLINNDKEEEHKALKNVFEEYQSHNIYDKSLPVKAFKSSFYNLLQKYKKENKLNESWIAKYKFILSYSKYKNIFGEDNSFEKNEKLEEECIKLWLDVIDYITTSADEEKHHDNNVDSEKRHDKFLEICEHNIFQDLMNKFINVDNRKDVDKLTYKDNVDFARSLDEKFHTIINPNKYGFINYYKIVNYYWHCYFYIVKKIMCYHCKNEKGETEFEKYIVKKDNETDLNCDTSEKNKKIDLNYEYILRNLNEFTKKLYETNLNENDNSYYHQIKKKFPKCSVLTTNYTPFVEKYFENNAYLNGKLKYMEYPELIKVVDATKDDIFANDKNKYSHLFFPFIFGQSYVKPIVHQCQVEEYRKMDEILRKSEKLVILGYNINSDDNHINAYIREFALKKEVYIVSDKDCLKNVREQLRLNDEGNIYFIEVDYKQCGKEIIDDVCDRLELEMSSGYMNSVCY